MSTHTHAMQLVLQCPFPFPPQVQCPDASGLYMQGDFHDVTFGFVRARLLRCNNGTDVEGKPLPGICHTPTDIDRLVYEGVLYMFQEERDMSGQDSSEFLRIRQWRREFVSRVHISTDVFFTVKEAPQCLDALMS